VLVKRLKKRFCEPDLENHKRRRVAPEDRRGNRETQDKEKLIKPSTGEGGLRVGGTKVKVKMGNGYQHPAGGCGKSRGGGKRKQARVRGLTLLPDGKRMRRHFVNGSGKAPAWTRGERSDPLCKESNLGGGFKEGACKQGARGEHNKIRHTTNITHQCH